MAGQKKRSVTPPKEEDRIIRVDPRESDGTFNNGPPPGFRDAPSGPTYTPLPAPPLPAPPKATPPKATAPVKPKYPGKPASPKAKPSPARQLPAKPKPGTKYPLGTATKKKK